MRKLCLMLAVILLYAIPIVAQGSSDLPKVEFEKYSLSNGLQVILHVDRKLPMVHVNIWYHVGSKNERVGRSGFAHLFEHMMFEGSKNANQKYFIYAEKAGANLFEGGVNGTTDWDRTNYFVTAPSANLENLLHEYRLFRLSKPFQELARLQRPYLGKMKHGRRFTPGLQFAFTASETDPRVDPQQARSRSGFLSP